MRTMLSTSLPKQRTLGCPMPVQTLSQQLKPCTGEPICWPNQVS